MAPSIFVPGREDALLNYARAVRAAGGIPRFSLCAEDSADCAGLLIPGGGDLEPSLYGQSVQGSRPPDPALDRLELDLLDRFTERRRPVLGICRGLQVINVFFGGTLHQDLPGHAQVEGLDRLHAVTAEEDSWCRRQYGSGFLVNSAHHQAVDRLGAGLQAAVWAPDGVMEAFRHQTLPIWGVQWHPERLMPGAGRAGGRALFRRFAAACEV